MKKKSLKMALPILLTTFGLILSGCVPLSPYDGDDKYQVYLSATTKGYEGTYEEWLTLLKGEKGDQGDKGDQGLPGQDGADGIDGSDGLDGNDGKDGDKGEKGDQGDKGDKGDQGDKGLPGQDGADGIDGIDGLDGNDGKSAYELYVEANPDYTGTESEWLDDLINNRLGNKQVHTVTFNSNGGTNVSAQLVSHGEKVIKPDVSRVGYRLDGWYLADEQWSFIGYVVTEDITLEASWSVETMELPIMTIDTLDGGFPVNKVDYLDAKVSIFNTENKYKIDNVDSGVRLRGNSTMDLDKKPFRLKFDKKQGLFGLEKQKKWNLIANHSDKSLMRTYLAYNTFRTLVDSSKFVPSTIFIDVYFNQEYMGVYMLTEQVEVTEGRVDIESEVGVLDTGYLIELDGRIIDEGEEGVDFFYSNGLPFSLESPEPDDGATPEQMAYIKQFMDNVFDALKNKNKELHSDGGII